jgi:hypothetical protein
MRTPKTTSQRTTRNDSNNRSENDDDGEVAADLRPSLLPCGGFNDLAAGETTAATATTASRILVWGATIPFDPGCSIVVIVISIETTSPETHL